MPQAPDHSDDEPDPGVGQLSADERGRQVAAPGALLGDVLEHGPHRVRGHHTPERSQPGGGQPPRRPTDGDGNGEGHWEDAERHAIGPQPARKPRGDVGTAQ